MCTSANYGRSEDSKAKLMNNSVVMGRKNAFTIWGELEINSMINTEKMEQMKQKVYEF